jgi:hypothetical protein
MVATVSFEMEGAAPNVCGYACFREFQNNDPVVKWSTHSAIAQNPSLMGETSGTPSTNHTQIHSQDTRAAQTGYHTRQFTGQNLGKYKNR